MTAESLAQQVQNPVTLFATDNNGVIVELLAVSAPETSVSGALVFGIGTQSNNGLNGATVYTVDANGNFITTYKGQSYNTSFIDSGSHAIFFLNSSTTGIPVCPDTKFYYCPSTTVNLSAINQGTNERRERQAQSTSVWPTPTICSVTTRVLLYLWAWRELIPRMASIGACLYCSGATCLRP